MLYNLSYSDTSWPYTNFLLLLLLPLLSKVYCLDVAKVFKNIKVVFENLIWHRNQQKPLGMCPLLLHVAHTLWKYTTSLLHKFMYPWHEILSPKNMGIIWRLSTVPSEGIFAVKKVFPVWVTCFLSSLKVLLTLLRKVGQVQGEGHEFETFLRTGTTSIEHLKKSSNRMLCLVFF